MKNLFFIIAIISVVFVSCDGRKSKRVSLKESIEEFKERQSADEIINYYPNEYVEVVTDTIISNKVKVHIKNFSLQNKGIDMSVNTHETSKNLKQHRVFESEIVISTPFKILFNAHMTAEQFKDISSDKFWDNATLQHVWVNQELSTSQDIKLDISFINPKNNTYKLYRMSIDENGQQRIDFVEQST
ncbi:MAG: hypothetical protein R2797_08020 [Gelidibacter sp.]